MPCQKLVCFICAGTSHWFPVGKSHDSHTVGVYMQIIRIPYECWDDYPRYKGVDRPNQGDVQMSELVQLLDISQHLSLAPPRFAYTLLISACNRAHEYQMVNELKAFGAHVDVER